MFVFSKSSSQSYKRRKDIRDRIIGLCILFFFIITIPLGIKLLQNQTQRLQDTQPHTQIVVTSLTPSAAVGDTISVAITLIPYKMSISVVKLVLTYDKSVLAVSKPLVINTLAFPTTLVNPDYTACNGNTCYISMTISTGAYAADSVTTKTVLGTIVFTAIAPAQQTKITIDSPTEVISQENQTHATLQTTPAVFPIHSKPQLLPPTQKDCTYQTVCLSCPFGALCKQFSCSKQLVCISPASPTVIPSHSSAGLGISITPTPPVGCNYELDCPTCAPGAECKQTCEERLTCANQ